MSFCYSVLNSNTYQPQERATTMEGRTVEAFSGTKNLLIGIAAALLSVALLGYLGLNVSWGNSTRTADPASVGSAPVMAPAQPPPVGGALQRTLEGGTQRGELLSGRFVEANAPRCAVIDFPSVSPSVTPPQVGRAAAMAMGRICSAQAEQRPALLDGCVQDQSFGELCYHAVLRR